MGELRRRVDRVWDDIGPAWPATAPSRLPLAATGLPRVNVFDAGASLVLRADVPGLSEKDVQVTLAEGSVSIVGERKVFAFEGYAALRQERRGVKFSRSVALPCRVDAERTQATVKNGVLTVTLAKAGEAEPRPIAARRIELKPG
jgi:HSP20 family protein